MPKKRKKNAHLSIRRKKGRYIRINQRDKHNECNINKVNNNNDDITISDIDSSSSSSSTSTGNKSNTKISKVINTDVANENITTSLVSDDDNDQIADDEVPVVKKDFKLEKKL